ncbi:MAG: SMP-30/gluconolactonase/LRE family protein [Kiritimatiellaceae bacterium]|nr:SMP-30/gluconolactonase/LRE family protein [Kiritimatiellaceae bacterium]
MKTFLMVLLMSCISFAEEWKVEKIADNLVFTEGPVWLDGGLVFSDIQGNTLYRWTEKEGLTVFRKPSENSNGNTLDPQGRLITCRHGMRDVIRTEVDGTLTVLASAFGGKKLNSPNDVVVQSGGTVWFTDPSYGIKPVQKEQPFNAVYRLDPGAAEPVAVITNLNYPNGLAFSPDGTFLYVAESDWKIKPNFVMRYSVAADKTLTNGIRFCQVESGAADGLRVAADGRLFCTSGLGVEVFDTNGKRLGVIRTPAPASNCCFTPDGKTLFVTARTAVYRVRIEGDSRD